MTANRPPTPNHTLLLDELNFINRLSVRPNCELSRDERALQWLLRVWCAAAEGQFDDLCECYEDHLATIAASMAQMRCKALLPVMLNLAWLTSAPPPRDALATQHHHESLSLLYRLLKDEAMARLPDYERELVELIRAANDPGRPSSGRRDDMPF